MSRKYKIAVLNGDGIGPEVVSSATEVLSCAAFKNGLNLEFVELPIGLDAYQKFGRTLPLETIDGMKESDGWILGPLQAGAYPKDDKDYPMASGKIRKTFDLFANIRPVRTLLKNSGTERKEGIDLVIVRENTEDFYPDRNLFKGYGEFWPNEDTVLSLRVVTRKACQRISEAAFRLALARKKKNLVTAVHKANVLIEGDGLFLEEARKAQENFGAVRLEEKLVDSAALQLVTSPESFDVILTTNLFGDILSDEAAGLVGGLGLAPSLNSGTRYAMAQAVHGSAPELAGKNVANPVAEILSTAMLLEWLYSSGNREDESLMKTAKEIRIAVEDVLSSGAPENRTLDIGGKSSTSNFTRLLITKIK